MSKPPKRLPFSREVSLLKAQFAALQEKVTSDDGSLEKAGETIMERIVFVIEHSPFGSLDKQTLTITVNGLLDPISFKFVHDGELKGYNWFVHSVCGAPNQVFVLFEKKSQLPK